MKTDNTILVVLVALILTTAIQCTKDDQRCNYSETPTLCEIQDIIIGEWDRYHVVTGSGVDPYRPTLRGVAAFYEDSSSFHNILGNYHADDGIAYSHFPTYNCTYRIIRESAPRLECLVNKAPFLDRFIYIHSMDTFIHVKQLFFTLTLQ